MGGSSGGPSSSQIRAEQALRLQEMQMQQAMFSKQMQQQMQMYKEQKLAYEEQRQQLEKQQRSSAIDAQNQYALNLRRQQEQKNQQEFSTLNNIQQILGDQSQQQTFDNSSIYGNQATGAGYNLQQQQQKATSNLANIPNLQTNPSNQFSESNAYSLPSPKGLQFGGV